MLLRALAPLLVIFLLSACIEVTENESESELGENKNDPPTAPSNNSLNLTGKVADGYLVDARVCLDLNDNFECDDSEPTTISLTKGNYSLQDLNQSDVDSHSIIVEAIAGETYDEDDPSATIAKSFTLSAPIGQTFISPLTTIIKFNMDSGISYTSAVVQFVSKTGLSIDPTVDYIAAQQDTLLSDIERSEYSSAHDVARVITGLIAEKLDADSGILISDIITIIDNQIARISDTIETAKENNEDIDIDDFINEVNDDITNTETIPCSASGNLCGIWHYREAGDDLATFDHYFEINVAQGEINGYFMEIGSDTCEREPSLIHSVNREWVGYADFDDDQLAQFYLSSITISNGQLITGSGGFLDAYNDSWEYAYNNVDTLPNPCEQLPTSNAITQRVSVGNDIIGNWIGSRNPFKTDPGIGGAFVIRADGTATFLDGFEAGTATCNDHEMEMTWTLNPEGKLTFIDTFDGEVEESFLYKTAGSSLVELSTWIAPNEWTPTSLTENQLRQKCDTDNLNPPQTEAPDESETPDESEPPSEPATIPEFGLLTNLSEISGISSYSINNVLTGYTDLNAITSTTGVLTDYILTTDSVSGNACTFTIEANILLTEAPVGVDMISILYVQDTNFIYDPYLLILKKENFTSTHMDVVRLTVEGFPVGERSGDRIDSIPVLPEACSQQ